MSTGVLLSIFDCSQENSKDAVYEMLRAIDIPVSHLRFFYFNLVQSSKVRMRHPSSKYRIVCGLAGLNFGTGST
jgi:hypothetical protein